MNFKLAEDLNRVEQEIVKKAGMLKNLIEQRNQLELEHKLKSQEMVHLQQELVTEEMKESQLSNRNTALRRIINNLDGNVKSEAENVGSDLRSFFKKLGLKVSLENDPEMETCNQLKIQFVENLNHHVILIYDSHMEDFDRKFDHKF